MLTFSGLLIGILILVLPGALILALGYKKSYGFSLLDKALAVLVLSGIFNYLFFLPRLSPPFRLGFYLLTLGLLFFFSFKKFWPFLKKVDWQKKYYVQKLWKSHGHFLGFILSVFIIAVVFVGYPYHQLNLSRSQLSPVGGDISFFLYKTHLLRGGYSFLDDLYYGEVTSYPNFPESQVALMTLITGGNLALNAEVYRLLLALVLFGLWFALGRALQFRPGESLIFALLSLSGYHIWQHLSSYVAAGMSFFATFLFLYFMVRAWLTRNRFLWLMAGLSATLVVHSHMVHAVFGAFFTFFMVLFYVVVSLKNRFAFKPIWNDLKWFLISGTVGSGIFLVPLWWFYRFKSTDQYHSPEGEGASWDLTLDQFFQQEFSAPSFYWAVGIIIFSWLLTAVFFVLKKKKGFFFLPAAHLWGLILVIIYMVEFIAIKIRHFAIYIDIRDFFNIVYPFRFVFIVLIGLRLLDYFLGQWSWKVVVMKTLTAATILSVLFFMLPANPTGYVPSFLNNYGGIWSWASLSESLEIRSTEGNIGPEWDFFAEEIHKHMPLYSSVLLTDLDVMLSLSGNFERQTMIYGAPWSNMFLPIPYEERAGDVKNLYRSPTPRNVAKIIKKYHVTHILWSWQTPTSVLDQFYAMPFLTFKAQPNFVGVLFEVDQSKL